MSILFAFAADLHLRPNAWVKHPTLWGDAYESLRQIMDFCRRERCPLLLGGDIFDQRRPDSDPVRRFCHEVEDFAGEGAPAEHVVYYVQGDHDFAAPTPWPQLSRLACHAHERLIELGPLKIYGMDWAPADQVQEALARIPTEANTLLTHLAWAEIQTIGATQASLVQLPPNITMVLTGDYHVNMAKAVGRTGQPPVVAYSPGSTCMQAIDESLKKHFWICRSYEDRYLMERVQLQTRPVMRLDFQSAEAFDQWIRGIQPEQITAMQLGLPEAISKPIFQIRYNDAIPDAHDRIKRALGDMVHLFEEPYHDFEVMEIDARDIREGAFETLTSAVQTIESDESIVRGALRLLHAEDPAAEIETMYEEFCRESGLGEVSSPAPTGTATS